ncbi:MerR family transcriptional regulator [uncultured Dialister sp.]|jgi:DNA-binding transcriptional MerR regulator|uniref:MerR family transcriptional regulator n=1 Tax=uncultured Dialister sp. TaxID=278064 RepID=UPI0025D5B3A3|nr:MerR family transcriptional regulator [uncultured Dialister sp.]
MAERLYTMKDVVELTGIPATTLQFYDKKGMLAFVKRSVSGVRIFTDRDIAILRMIQFFRNIDMPIRDITHFITLYQQGASTREERIRLFRQYIGTLEEERKEKEEQVKAASYIDKLLKGKLDAGITDDNLPLSLTKKDIPPELQDFFSHRDQ